MTTGFDWAEFERVLHDGLVAAVVSEVSDRPGERFYAAVLDRIYRETDGVITLPALGVNSVEALAREPVEVQGGCGGALRTGTVTTTIGCRMMCAAGGKGR